MKSNRRPVERDYGTLFLGGILLGIVIVVLGIMLAFTQARGHVLPSRDHGEQSSRLKRPSGFSLNGSTFISGSMERNRIG